MDSPSSDDDKPLARSNNRPNGMCIPVYAALLNPDILRVDLINLCFPPSSLLFLPLVPYLPNCFRQPDPLYYS